MPCRANRSSRKLYIEKHPKPQGHINIAGKIEIVSKRISKDSSPGFKEIAVLHDIVKILRIGDQRVRDQYLLSASDGKIHDALYYICCIDPPDVIGPYLLHHMIMADYGADDQLGEKGDKHRVLKECTVSSFAPVGLNDMRQNLKCVEGYADGQRDFVQDIVRAEYIVHIPDEKIHVLEIEQQPKVLQYRQCQQQLRYHGFSAVFPEQLYDDIVENHRSCQQGQKYNVAISIEKQGRSNEPCLCRPVARKSLYQVINCKNYRQKNKNESV